VSLLIAEIARNKTSRRSYTERTWKGIITQC